MKNNQHLFFLSRTVSAITMGIIIGLLWLAPLANARPVRRTIHSNTTETIESETFTPTNQICVLEGLVEISNNIFSGDYFYQELKEESLDPDHWRLRHDGNEHLILQKVQVGLYRKCYCYPADSFSTASIGLGDNIWDRGSLGSIDGNIHEKSQDTTAATKEIHTNLCPLEAQTCAILYLSGTTKCYTTTSKITKAQLLIPIIIICFSLLLLGLFVTASGRQTIHYIIIKVKERRWCNSCSSNGSSSLPSYSSVGDTYNTALLQRAIQREAEVRRIRRAQWNIPGAPLGPERDPIEFLQRNPIADWWLIYQHNRRNDNSDNSDSSAREEFGNNSFGTSVDLLNVTSYTTPSPYRERRRELGIQGLSFRTKTYSKVDAMDESSNKRRSTVKNESVAAVPLESDSSGTANENTSERASKTARKDRTNVHVDSTNTNRNTDDDDDNNAICVICVGVIHDGETIGDLPHCNHVFHKSCLKQWIVQKNQCPMCLRPVGQSFSR